MLLGIFISAFLMLLHPVAARASPMVIIIFNRKKCFHRLIFCVVILDVIYLDVCGSTRYYGRGTGRYLALNAHNHREQDPANLLRLCIQYIKRSENGYL
jgi:hypothetical protein